MSKKVDASLIVAFFAVMLPYISFAQERVVWADRVLSVSSEQSPYQYAASQATYQPNVYPGSGSNANAWRPKFPDKQEFIIVEFGQSMRAQQIAIAETENPGAVHKVYAYDERDNEYLLLDIKPRKVGLDSRMLNLFFPQTDYEIAYIKVELACAEVTGFNSIDAIGISNSNVPIKVLINISSNVNNKAEAEKLGTNVNSSYKENSPLLAPDGKTLYFTRQYHPENVGGVEDSEDIWFSKLDEKTGMWLPAENIGPPLNTAGPNFVSTIIQKDNDELLLLGNQYGKNGKMYAGVSMTKKSGDSWTTPENLSITNDYNYSVKSDYYMNTKADALLMAVERDDTFGDRDLYVSFKSGNSWTEPLNLGAGINTISEERAPFLSADSKKLYFSSAGYSGYGGSDVYVSRRMDNSWTSWSEPENLGAAVNTPEDDIYINIPTSGENLFFTRSGTNENTDVYKLKKSDFFIEDKVEEEEEPTVAALPKLKISGKVIDTKTGQPIQARIRIERLPDGMTIGSVETKEKGDYNFNVISGARYALIAERDGYLSVSENFDFNDVKESKAVIQDLKMVPVEKGSAIALNSIFFDFAKAVLRTASYSELDRVLTFLKENPDKKVEVAGHTDSKGADDYNKALSTARANAVYKYLLENGVNSENIQSKGYGESSPVADNDTPQNRSKNRRVEFKILN